ncbi:hypothetical protein D9M71_693920 [compost metagenome]
MLFLPFTDAGVQIEFQRAVTVGVPAERAAYRQQYGQHAALQQPSAPALTVLLHGLGQRFGARGGGEVAPQLGECAVFGRVTWVGG